MADPERCFCCLESDVLLHRCTCRCLTLAVCDRCFFELACKSRTCTVCRAPVGSAAVVRACEWALQSVRTLPPTDVARQTVELRALSEILWTHEYAPTRRARRSSQRRTTPSSARSTRRRCT